MIFGKVDRCVRRVKMALIVFESSVDSVKINNPNITEMGIIPRKSTSMTLGGGWISYVSSSSFARRENLDMKVGYSD